MPKIELKKQKCGRLGKLMFSKTIAVNLNVEI